ncbi:hypothetical protein F5X68DRAFT_275572 [Plectosphaerella plurivora]|uniref:MARVEL domain-containing protein n=1 Tax=Plectosphaerella plurivora TaxID=936078 RepID=A0A9P8VCT5_9PEZI|nr:hypothetical protein F5X68DRAFT_275572 [Plectosphaerella plurivora]
MTETTHLTTAERKPGWEHVPVYPRGFIGLRIAQFVLAFLVLGLSAFGVWGLPISGICLTLFVSLATLITTVWLLVAHFAKPRIYNYWAVLSLDIFLVIFWLVAFAVLASQVSALYSLVGLSSYYYDYSYYYSSSTLESTIFTAWLACQAAASALGGVLFVLFVVTLVMHVMALHRHRAAGRHSTPGSAVTPAGTSAPVLAPYGDKTNPVQSYPAPVYTQTQQTQGYPPQQQQQQYYDPSAVTSPSSATQAPQGYYAPQQQQQQQMYGDGQYQHQPQPQYQQQQPGYPPQTTSPPPLSAQYTGSSTAPAPVQQQQQPPQNNAVEVPAQSYQQH